MNISGGATRWKSQKSAKIVKEKFHRINWAPPFQFLSDFSELVPPLVSMNIIVQHLCIKGYHSESTFNLISAARYVFEQIWKFILFKILMANYSGEIKISFQFQFSFSC